MNYPFEVIKWQDHASLTNSDWKTMAEIFTLSPQTILSAGWIVKETDHYLILVTYAGLDNDEDITETSQGEMCIIKSAILERHPIRKFNK